MTAFLIASVLWIALLLGALHFVGHTLGRRIQAVNEAPGRRVRGGNVSYTPARSRAASTLPPSA